MSGTIDNTIMEKLTKIKALAEDAKTEAEGKAAILAFQRLLSKHGLSASAVDVFVEEKQNNIQRNYVYKAQRIPRYIRCLYIVIARHFRCASCSDRTWDASKNCWYSRCYFVGKDTDPELAKAAFECALKVMDKLYEERKRDLSDGTKKAKQDYCLSFLQGLDEAYTEQEDSPEFSIIVVRDPDVDEAIKDHKNNHISTQPKGRINYRAMIAGYTDGHNYGKGNTLREYAQ